MHLHVSALDFIKTAAYFIVFMFLWRQLAAKLHDRTIGKAMAAVAS